MAAHIFEFGDFQLDSDRFELSRAGRVLKLERKPLELLILLATREGDVVTRTEIAQHLWGKEVFVDTEHGINTAVRKVRQALRDEPDHPRFVHTITGRGYRFVGPVVQISPLLPASLVVSPAPASALATPESTAAGKSASPRRAPLWLTIGIPSALVLLTLAITPRAHRTHAAIPTIRSLAVLPLDNLSGDPGQNYFADGMTDELTTMLAKNSTLRVVSRTSALQYRNAHRPIRDIASALGVDGIVEGSVERSPGKVHMTLQLIQTSTDTHIWADSYDRGSNDVAELPGEAARDIAARLHSTVLTPVVARYVSPEAHDAYLRGRYLTYAYRYDEAAQYFKKATEIDPNYALGWAGLATIYCQSAMHGTADPRDVLQPCYQMAAKALALDPSLPESHVEMAGALALYRWDLNQADQEILRAIALDPKYAAAYHLRARILTASNRDGEAIQVQKREMELDPFSRPWGMAETYFNVRQYKAAIDDAQLRLENSPDDILLLSFMADSYRCLGDTKHAVEVWERMYTALHDPASATAIQLAYRKGGDRGVLRWQLHDLEKRAKTSYVSPVSFASLYGQLGDRDKALASLEDGLRQRHPWMLWIQTDAAFDSLHDNQRYRALIKKIGLPPAW